MRGVTHDGDHLFILATEDSKPTIFMVDPGTQTLVDKFVWTFSATPDHLAYDGFYYYVIDTGERMVYVIDTHFAYHDKFPLPPVETQGICIDGSGRLLVVSPGDSEILVLDPVDGTQHGTIPIPTPRVRQGMKRDVDLMSAGVAFDGTNLWHSMVAEDGTGELMQMNMAGDLMNQFALSDYVTSLTFNFGPADALWATIFDFAGAIVVEYPAFAPLLPWADIWAEPNPVPLGGPVQFKVSFYNTDPILAEPFIGVFGLGIMFEYEWEYRPLFWLPMYLPAESSYEDIPLFTIESYPYLPSHYFMCVLVTEELEFVSYDIEDMDDMAE